MYLTVGFLVALFIVLLIVLNIQQQWIYVALDTPEKQFGYSMLGVLAFVITMTFWPLVVITGLLFGIYILIRKI